MRCQRPRSAALAVFLLAVAVGCQSDRLTDPATRSAISERSLSATNSYAVHVVYLVPADREVRKGYVRALRGAIEHLQIWYRNALGTGETFRLAKPVVEVVQLSQPASYYATTPRTDSDPALFFWFNVLSEAFALTGGGFYDLDDVWVYYVDAAPACNQATGAAAGVALLPANDLRGLAGEPTIDPCSGEVEPDQGTCRWVGGLGHELGHAFGLPHPPECEPVQTASCPFDALLFFGYTTYPDAFLTAADKTALSESPFFTPINLREKLPECSKISGSSQLIVTRRSPEPLRLRLTKGLGTPCLSGRLTAKRAPVSPAWH
jgi:hypothetical protein